MADITSRYQGNVEPSGKVNWRGDQIAAPQGGQSIYASASVLLAELGSRKVVGDRVFRYAQAGGVVGAGDLTQVVGSELNSVTAGGSNPSGGKSFSLYVASAITKDEYAEGYLISQNGTAANMGHFYRVKSHPAIGDTSTGTLTLYDELVNAENPVDEWCLMKNEYASITQMVAGTAAPVGVAPIAVTSGDYFWLQTFGPISVKGGAVPAGQGIIAAATGAIGPQVTGNTKVEIGYALMTITASERGLAFITIAP